jgi:preprotein translocase subunit SecG
MLLNIVIGLMMVVALLLVIVILPQSSSKGGGLTGSMASGANQLIGVKKTTDLLEKITWGLMIGIFVFSLLTHVL